MGAGIGFIPGAIRTIHIDFIEDYDFVKQDMMEQDRERYLEELSDFDTLTSKKAYVTHNPLREPSEDEIWEKVGFMSSLNYNDTLSNLGYLNVCGMKNAFGEKIYKDEWSAEFRGRGQLLAQNDDVYLVGIQSTDQDIGIGVVPKQTEDDFIQEYYDDNQDKEFWYDQRGKDFSASCDKNGAKLYAKYMAKVEKQEQIIIAKINENYAFTYRSSAWTMTPEVKVGTLKAA